MREPFDARSPVGIVLAMRDLPACPAFCGARFWRRMGDLRNCVGSARGALASAKSACPERQFQIKNLKIGHSAFGNSAQRRG